MRRLRSAIAVVVALALLVGVAYLGDRGARSAVEDRVESLVREQVPELTGDVEATVGGRFVIPQLVAGSLDDLTIRSPEATVDGLTFVDVTVTATGVPIRGDGGVDAVTATGTAPTHTVLSAIQQRVDLPDGVEIELRDGEIAAVGQILGVSLEAYVEPVAAGRSITFHVSRFVLGGATVDASDIPIDLDSLLSGATVDLGILPEGIELTSIDVTPDGVAVELGGTDVRL